MSTFTGNVQIINIITQYSYITRNLTDLRSCKFLRTETSKSFEKMQKMSNLGNFCDQDLCWINEIISSYASISAYQKFLGKKITKNLHTRNCTNEFKEKRSEQKKLWLLPLLEPRKDWMDALFSKHIKTREVKEIKALENLSC